MLISYQKLATSDSPSIQRLRRLRRGIQRFTLPAPAALVRPILWGYLGLRTVYHFIMRVFIAEPLFKAYCRSYGRGVRTGIYVHWIMGKGDILLGDNVLLDGKCTISFAARFVAHPTLEIGDGTGIGHNCVFTVGKRITIGRYCMIATDVFMFDSSGHPTSPQARQAGAAPTEEDVRPITIEDHVWIGRRAIIYPGVTVGHNSIISAGAAVMSDVPPYTVVAGNPARKVASLAPQESPAPAPAQPVTSAG